MGIWISLLALLLAACLPQEPSGFTYTPPPEYRVWWEEAKSCVVATNGSIVNSFDDIEWKLRDTLIAVGKDSVYGAFYKQTKTVLIVKVRMNDPQLIKHESIHAMTEVMDHPYLLFLCQVAK